MAPTSFVTEVFQRGSDKRGNFMATKLEARNVAREEDEDTPKWKGERQAADLCSLAWKAAILQNDESLL